MTNKIVTLDVREDFHAGQHPCDKIHGALNHVGADETLRLLVPFEPVPLFNLAARIGLTYQARPQPGGDWEVLFSQNPNPAADRVAQTGPAETGGGCGCHEVEPRQVIDLDARGLQPPQPMVKILEALECLPTNAAVMARTDRRPVHLYGFLEDRGFTGDSEEQADGSFITHIRRR